MNITTHEPDIVNEAIVEDFVAQFDDFLEKRQWGCCDAVIDALGRMKQYDLALSLAKRLTARKMTVPSDYGEKEWRGSCGAPIYDSGKMVAACVVTNCQTHYKKVPADYGEEKYATRGPKGRSLGSLGVVESQMDAITNGLIF